MSSEEELILELVSNNKFFDVELISKVNWKKLVDIIWEKKIFLFLYPIIKHFIHDKEKIKCDELYNTLYHKTEKQIREIEIIHKAFVKEGINAVFIKGVFLSKIAYDSFNARQSNDIDILVKKEEMLKAYKVLHKLGYRFLAGFEVFEGNLINPKLLDSPEFLFSDEYHEYPCLKQDQKGDIVAVELKYATSAISYKNINDFMNNTQNIVIEETKIRTFNIHFTLLHIIAHLYENIQGDDNAYKEIGLRDFVDLKMFIKQFYEIDWNFIYVKSKEYEITHQIYFALFSLNLLWKNTIEIGIVELFNVKKIKYNYKGDEHGERFTWKNDIITRCFDRKERLREYCYLYKSELFQIVDADLIQCTDKIYEFSIQKKEIECRIFIIHNVSNNNISLSILYDQEMFRKRNLYFVLTLIDNDMTKELLERKVYSLRAMPKIDSEICWEDYMYKNQVVKFVTIKTDTIFSSLCNKIYMLVDIYKNVGDVGYRGTGAKREFIIYNTVKV